VSAGRTSHGPASGTTHPTASRDDRHIRVDGRPLFLIFDPHGLPARAGLAGLFIIAIGHLWRDPALEALGFDGTVTKFVPPMIDAGQHPTVYDHETVIDELVYLRAPGENDFPCVAPNWDNTPRSGRRGVVLHNSRPQLFRRNLLAALDAVVDEPEDRQLIFIKAWNEWGEGNHLEPDLRFGHGFLEQILAISEPRLESTPPIGHLQAG
jgi:hypothetical protein